MISAVVLTKNEEKNILECLEGLKWSDEIVVVDDNSTDKTREIAQKAGAKVFTRALDSDFAGQRNFALEKARYDWIFFVDADERVSPELAVEVQKKIKNTKTAGFYFRRIDNFMGHWLKHGEIGGIRILRLARRGSGRWERAVDEKWQVAGETKTFKNPLFHYAHPDLTQFLKSVNERTGLNARVFYEEGRKVNFLEWIKPVVKFKQNYIFKLGFLDGLPGFIFAVLMSLHSFLVRGKLYLIWRREGGWK